MNKQVLVLCTVLALLLLSGIGYGFYKLFSTSSFGLNDNDSRTSVLYAVPSDAIIVCDLEDYSSFSSLIGKGNPLSSFLKLVPDSAEDYSMAVSLHHSTRNEVSVLFILSLPKSLDKEEFVRDILAKCSGVIHKKYDGNTIYSSVVPRVAYSVCGNFLIASTSLVILESSIRHLQSRSSILDNKTFQKLSPMVKGGALLHINHQNLGNLFSGVVNKPYLRYADFFRTFSAWTTISMDFSDNSCLGRGQIYNDDESSFSNIFNYQESLDPDVYNHLPFNTNYFLSVNVQDSKTYVSKYKAYLDAQKKVNDYTYLNAAVERESGGIVSTSDWFFSMQPSEIAVADIPVGTGSERVFMIRVNRLDSLKGYSKEVNEFKYKGYISAFLGEAFKPSAEEAFCVVSEWVVIGSTKAVSAYYTAYRQDDYFSFSKYIAQTPADFSIGNNVSALFMMNLSRSKEILRAIFKKPLSENLVSEFSENNFNFFSLALRKDGSKLSLQTSIVMDNLTKFPSKKVKTAEGEKSRVVVDDTPIVLSKGPFIIKHFLSGKKNYIQQLQDNKLRLLDHDKKPVWTISFLQPLCGYVEQIDYLKNNKLQVIFAAGSKVHLVDRLGRWVSPFPIDLKKEIVLGPEIHDFRGVRSYSMMVLHADNTVELYDINGKRVLGWNVIQEDERIKSMPEILYVGGKRYWVVRTFFQTKIYSRVGLEVADFSKKKSLKSNTKIERLSSNEVIITSIENNDMILNLETGVFRRLK